MTLTHVRRAFASVTRYSLLCLALALALGLSLTLPSVAFASDNARIVQQFTLLDDGSVALSRAGKVGTWVFGSEPQMHRIEGHKRVGHIEDGASVAAPSRSTGIRFRALIRKPSSLARLRRHSSAAGLGIETTSPSASRYLSPPSASKPSSRNPYPTTQMYRAA